MPFMQFSPWRLAARAPKKESRREAVRLSRRRVSLSDSAAALGPAFLTVLTLSSHCAHYTKEEATLNYSPKRLTPHYSQ